MNGLNLVLIQNKEIKIVLNFLVIILIFEFRFVSYLVCPVFHEKTVENEVEIVQCEHEKNKYSDVWRLNQVRISPL